MKTTFCIGFGFISLLLLLAACAPAREVAVAPTAVAQPMDTPTPVFTGAMPVSLPASHVDQAGDVNSSPNAAKKVVTGGDVFVNGLYERPFNANTMDTYFPYLDLIGVRGFQDDLWGYATITVVDTDANGALPGDYGVELDLDRDGRGDWLILVSRPSGNEWSRKGVRAWTDADGKVGGNAIHVADNHPAGGNGYESLIFDEGNGNLTDGAWARVQPEAANIVEISFKLDMLGNPRAYALGAWAASTLDPGMFDHHDGLTHVEAGSPNPGYEVYPLKGLAEIDNTCHLSIGFSPTGSEAGSCATLQMTEKEPPGCHYEPCTVFTTVCRPVLVCP